MGCCQALRFFLKHSFQDILKHKCHFCLAFWSVLIVVLSTLVVNTITSKGPIIFMRLAEEDSGEIDVVYVPGKDKDLDSNSLWNDFNSLNFTKAEQVLKEQDIEHYMSPRQQLCPPNEQMQVTNADTGSELGPDGSMCLKFIDTDREKNI